MGRLLHALDPQEADRTLLRVRELLLEIAQENQLAPDIIQQFKAAVTFSDRPLEGFKLSEAREDYQTPQRLGHLKAERRAQQKADLAKSREKRHAKTSLAGFRGAGAHWTPGSLRDAFCSYHLAHYGSIDRLITEAGHTSLRTTKDHYLGLVWAEVAAEFWSLYPPGVEERPIVAFNP